jgi:hypothetical protein
MLIMLQVYHDTGKAFHTLNWVKIPLEQCGISGVGRRRAPKAAHPTQFMIRTLRFLPFVAVAGMLQANDSPPPVPERPNILFIMLDDVGAEAFSSYDGNPVDNGDGTETVTIRIPESIQDNAG